MFGEVKKAKVGVVDTQCSRTYNNGRLMTKTD